MNSLPFRHANKSLATLALASAPLLAFASIDEADISQLESITVQGEAPPGPEDTTGLARIEKTAEDLDSEQVMGIRDLLRYDPGIAVNESGGRGTSTGFSMRGVDKERVAVTVDGMAQGQTLERQQSGPFGKGQGRASGAKNEVEYENLKAVDISQGASSVQAGSGALGGAVMMQTKDPSDFLRDGKQWGVNSKTGYSSKDGRWMQSLGAGFQSGALEGFVQHTARKGHEARPHKDIYDTGAEIVRYRTDASGQTTEMLSARELSGPERKVPNPMRYRSASWLAKLNYEMAPGHRAGIVHEDTRQRYDLRDMFERNYWSLHSHESQDNIFMASGNIEALAFTPTRFVYDRHRYQRTGLEYRFLPISRQPWVDNLRVRLDRQNIQTRSKVDNLLCAPYPEADPGCRPEPGHTGTRMYLGDTRYTQQLARVDVAAGKSFELWRKHTLWINAGLERSRAILSDTDRSAHAYREYNHADGLVHDLYDATEFNYATPPIRGQHVFIAINDTVRLADKWLLGLGLRYDRHVFRADQGIFEQNEPRVRTGLDGSRYRNLSWDLGVVHHLTPAIDLAYKTTSGFRVPSVGEQLGPAFNWRMSRPAQPELKAETSRNHEIGLHLDGRYGKLSASYFLAEYRNLIALGMPLSDSHLPNANLYLNLQSVKTKGINLRGSLDLHEAWRRLPQGLEATLALSHVKPRGQAPRAEGLMFASSYSLDMLQPLRVVYGLEFNHPSNTWGIAARTTYSAAKKPDELTSNAVLGGMKYLNDSKASLRTPKWIVTDLNAYYRFNDMITLRAAAYNIFNYRYITWESGRQASKTVMNNNLSEISHLALAAPGRNYALNLEMKY
jgi:hemoglobin/transferrin/lactoferrin receptor protein